MLKTYRIIPLVFILFLFGLTLMTVSPVFAEDSSEFVACQKIKPRGDFRLMKQKKNCFRDVARSLQGQSGDSVQSVAPLETSGGEVAELNAKIAELEARLESASMGERSRSRQSGSQAIMELQSLRPKYEALELEHREKSRIGEESIFALDYVCSDEKHNRMCNESWPIWCKWNSQTEQVNWDCDCRRGGGCK